MVILSLLALLLCNFQSSADNEDVHLSLSTLNAECRLEKKWLGFVQVLPEAVWLDCRDVRFLVTNPNNLMEHVSIRTPKQALEYVRFFTSADTYRYFELGGMVEILPGEVTKESDFNILEREKFVKNFKEAIVQELPPEEIQKGSTKEKSFRISRVVVCLDQKVYEVNEFVTETGFYNITSRKVLIEDALKLGIVHLGDI